MRRFVRAAGLDPTKHRQQHRRGDVRHRFAPDRRREVRFVHPPILLEGRRREALLLQRQPLRADRAERVGDGRGERVLLGAVLRGRVDTSLQPLLQLVAFRTHLLQRGRGIDAEAKQLLSSDVAVLAAPSARAVGLREQIHEGLRGPVKQASNS